MKRPLFFLVTLFMVAGAYARQARLDCLLGLLHSQPVESCSRSLTLIALSETYATINPKMGSESAKEALRLARESKNAPAEADALNASATCLLSLGRFTEADSVLHIALATDASIHPGAPDQCSVADGADNDCDGQIDEDGFQLWYLDADGDGSGVEANTVSDCTQPIGYSPIAGDRNDSEVLAYTGAAEVCGNVDNDCDGELDEGFYWFTDSDGDGVGTLAFPVYSCTPVTGLVNIGGDCDDNDPGVHVLVSFGISLSEGATAQYVITNGGMTYTGEIEELSPGLGLENLRLPTGCAQVAITTSGMPEGTLGFFSEIHNSSTFVNFLPADGYATTLGGVPAPEICDGIDNNCDGVVDEGFETYADSDGGGFGDPNIIMPCDTPFVEQLGSRRQQCRTSPWRAGDLRWPGQRSRRRSG